jgi:hypothetical protein
MGDRIEFQLQAHIVKAAFPLPAQPASRIRMTMSNWPSVGTQARWHGFRVHPTLCRVPLGANRYQTLLRIQVGLCRDSHGRA